MRSAKSNFIIPFCYLAAVPQEVEAALGSLPGVRQAVTALAKNPATDPATDHLVAWVSPKDLEPSALLQQLQCSLPEYMLP